MLRRLALPILLCLGAAQLQAEELHKATGTPLLTIRSAGTEIALDAEGLRELPAATFVTGTIWTEGPQTFTGIRMTELLDRLHVTGGTMILTAANDYQITIPVESFTPDGALLAYERNGTPMTLRDKGPLWLVYPYDADPRFRTEIVYANSIWQLARIEFAE